MLTSCGCYRKLRVDVFVEMCSITISLLALLKSLTQQHIKQVTDMWKLLNTHCPCLILIILVVLVKKVGKYPVPNNNRGSHSVYIFFKTRFKIFPHLFLINKTGPLMLDCAVLSCLYI